MNNKERIEQIHGHIDDLHTKYERANKQINTLEVKVQELNKYCVGTDRRIADVVADIRESDRITRDQTRECFNSLVKDIRDHTSQIEALQAHQEDGVNHDNNLYKRVLALETRAEQVDKIWTPGLPEEGGEVVDTSDAITSLLPEDNVFHIPLKPTGTAEAVAQSMETTRATELGVPYPIPEWDDSRTSPMEGDCVPHSMSYAKLEIKTLVAQVQSLEKENLRKYEVILELEERITVCDGVVTSYQKSHKSQRDEIEHLNKQLEEERIDR